ncbi:MAG: hypothetical protein ACLQVD_02410 [Capsulimonadaceae bacterium]
MSQEALISEAELDRLSQIGRTLYDEHLKAVLEPEHNGEDVAIHLDTADYEVGPRRRRPHFAVRKRHPEGGYIMVTTVGPPVPDDPLRSVWQRLRSVPSILPIRFLSLSDLA